MASKQAVAYVRVSTEEQSRDGYSLDAQEQRIRDYAERNAIEIVQVFREEGVSAKDPLRKRPQATKMLATLAKRKDAAKNVIAVKLDRLFRNMGEACTQLDEWTKARIGVQILDIGNGQPIDTTTSAGMMQFGMMALMGQMERTLISERTRDALADMRRKGEVYNHVPLGFDADANGKLVPNHREMITVNAILGMRELGLSMHKIADRLNAAGEATKNGKHWYASTVQNVLRLHSKADAA